MNEQIKQIVEAIREQVLEGEKPFAMCQRVNEPIGYHIATELGLKCFLVNVSLKDKDWSKYNHHVFVQLEDGTVIDGVFDQMGNRDEIYIGYRTAYHTGPIISRDEIKPVKLRRRILEPA